MQNEWAKTITANSVSFNHQLSPLWDLVRQFNPSFADKMEKKLKDKWALEYELAKNLKFLDFVQIMRNHKLKDPLRAKLLEAENYATVQRDKFKVEESGRPKSWLGYPKVEDLRVMQT